MIVNRPPMGWNSWNTFANNINEELIKQMADLMVNDGYLDAGYEYLVIDDCWALRERDENDRLVADPEKFPNGMKAVADYVHSKGLKFGMYSCAGNYTCAGYPSSYEHEFIDAETFASWGVDFLKYDYCYRPKYDVGEVLYRRMGMALANCGRDILFSACSWGADETHTWIKQTGAHMWRSTGDINDSWASIRDLTEQQLKLLPYNGQGCFNDMDMLVVGMKGKGHVGLKGCTMEEYRSHFSVWAMLGSPLMMGNDLRIADDEIKSILLNKDVIAIDQDAAYRQPYLVNRDKDMWVVAKQLEGGDLAILMLNLADTDCHWNVFFSLADLGLNRSSNKALEITDVWTGENLGVFNDSFRYSELPAHGCKLLRAKIVDRK